MINAPAIAAIIKITRPSHHLVIINRIASTIKATEMYGRFKNKSQTFTLPWLASRFRYSSLVKTFFLSLESSILFTILYLYLIVLINISMLEDYPHYFFKKIKQVNKMKIITFKTLC